MYETVLTERKGGMDMHLIIGGAFAGKRKIVRKQFQGILCWYSAYDGKDISGWNSCWDKGATLVLEGWEKWIEACILQEQEDEFIRKKFDEILLNVEKAEKERGTETVLVMLEMGRGIVPMEHKDRRLRDIAGWVLQDAASRAGEVYYVWHGLAQRLK
jgi:adenosylcobinamide kinase/adenosylcobinamide-phosphate guanylyltransferase